MTIVCDRYKEGTERYVCAYCGKRFRDSQDHRKVLTEYAPDYSATGILWNRCGAKVACATRAKKKGHAE